MNKEKLRQIIRERKETFSETEKKRASEAVLKLLEEQPFFQQAARVMLYWSLPDEVFTHDFIEKWASEKTILLPGIENDCIVPRVFHSKNDLQKGLFGIAEPVGQPFSDKIDLVVAPALAFDKNRHRLGRGKGFYDRFFANYDGIKCGIAWDFQLVDALCHETHDVPIDYVVAGGDIY